MNENKGKYLDWTMRFAIMEMIWKTITNTIIKLCSEEQKKRVRKGEQVEWIDCEREKEMLEEKEEKSIFSIYAFSIIMDTKC